MSGHWDRHERPVELATGFEQSRSSQGQGHDRIHGDNPIPEVSETIAMMGDISDDVEIDITAGQKMLSAISGSLLTSLLVTPLDVVRVRLQSQPKQSPLTAIQKLPASSRHSFNTMPANLGVTACCREVFFANNAAEYCIAAPKVGEFSQSIGGAECAVEETQRKTFNTTFDGLRKIARNEGFTTLWRGLSPTLVMTIPANIIYFTGYDWLRHNKKSPINRVCSDGYAPLAAGVTARIFAAGLVSPIEMFKTRMQASRSTGGHIAETIKGIGEMVSTSGYTSLWRGLTLTLWRDVPFSGIYWLGYESIRGALTDARERGRGRSLEVDGSLRRSRSRSQSRENHTATFIDSFVAGATSGAVASILTMPFDVGKTRRQIFTDGPAAGALAAEEQSMVKFLLQIFKEEGIAGLWKGWIPRTLKVAPACAIMISSYEVGKRTFRSLNERTERRQAAL